ncbi:MAG: AAA family ATPase [Actinomycetota bacterium]
MPMNRDYQARSRAGLRRKAIRPALPARLLMLAPSGAGKSWSALSIATELVGTSGSIVAIDTERQQGQHTALTTYADVFDFDYIPWEDNWFDPRDLRMTLRDLAESMGENDVLVIDGIAPFWTGRGGALEKADTFGGWKDVRPMLADLMDEVKSFPSHVIVTVRAKTEWEISEKEDDRGRRKQNVEMLGLGPQFDKDIVYEMQVAVTLDRTHKLTVFKSRSTVLADREFPAEHERDFAAKYQEWLAGGSPLLARAAQDEIMELLNAPYVKADRAALKRRFLAEFGDPKDMLAADGARAMQWAAEASAEYADTPPEDASADDDAPALAAAPDSEPEPEAETAGFDTILDRVYSMRKAELIAFVQERDLAVDTHQTVDELRSSVVAAITELEAA